MTRAVEETCEEKSSSWKAKLTLGFILAMQRRRCLRDPQGSIRAGSSPGWEADPTCAFGCSCISYFLLEPQLGTGICYKTKFPRQLFVGKVIWLSYLKIDALKAFLNLLIKYDALQHYQRKCWQAGFLLEHPFSSNRGPSTDPGVAGAEEGLVWPPFKTMTQNDAFSDQSLQILVARDVTL